MSGALEVPAGPIEPGKQNGARSGRHPDAEGVRVLSLRDGYELWAQSYDQGPNPLLALEERLLTPNLPSLQGRRVLDVACGTGRWLSILLLRGASSGMGVDCSAAMIAAARSKPLVQGRLVQADILALPLPGAASDLVMCSFAIGHFPNVSALAAEIARVTSPQAAVYLSDVHPEAYRKGWRAGFRSNGRPVEITTFFRPLEQIFEAFAAQGLALAESIEGCLGDPERPIFERAGRLDRFHQFRGLPAVFIARFGHTGPARRHRDQ